MDRCEKCGEPIQIGSWPFCKGGHGRGTNNVIGDEIDEWNENVGDKPVHFTSRSERRRYLAAHGLREFVRHVGEQGSDKNPRTSRWI